MLNIWLLLTRDSTVFVLISCVIASPIALYFFQHWLQNYDYGISFVLWVFIAAAISAVVITIITIRFKSMKAATANPVKTFRMV